MTPHGLMFHYFHDNKRYIPSQGSITANEFDRMLSFYKKRFNVLSAEQWLEKARSNTLTKRDACVTFDDTLRCQFDIALPVLQKHNLKAFWFICTAVFQKDPPKLELYRYYRFKKFKRINDFYAAFDERIASSPLKKKVARGLKRFDHKKAFIPYRIYTLEDKKFRYIRDMILNRVEYEWIMDRMIKDSGLEPKKLYRLLWVNQRHILKLSKLGHIIGLHSHTHPTNLKKLPKKRQEYEYEKNISVLTRLLHKDIITMSHPDNSYSTSTLRILKTMGVTIGFRATMDKKKFSKLEFPRLDQAYLIKEIRK